jgi:hypothetical protein
MITATAQLTPEEIVERGKEIYERAIRHLVEADNKGRVIAIDIHSEEYELADDAITSASRLRARVPDAEIYVSRVGYPGLHRILRVVRQR